MYKHLGKLATHQKYQMILNLLDYFKASQNPIGVVATVMGCSTKTIENAIKWRNNPIELTEKRGKKRILKQHHMLYINNMTLVSRDITNSELIQRLKDNFQDLPESLSEQTIIRARKELGFRYLPPLKACNLSNSGKRKRVEFCNNHLENRTDFKNVVFTDESWFELGANHCWIYRKPGEISPDVTRSYQSHPQKVMIWGGIGYNFKTKLVFIEGSVTADSYFEDIILGSGMIQDADNRWELGRWVLQQDNARPHVANTVFQSLDYLEIHFIDDWPPCSPDLNPIEVVWAIMKIRIEKQRPKSLNELKELITLVWESLSYDTINKLIEELPRRCLTLKLNDGETIQKLIE